MSARMLNGTDLVLLILGSMFLGMLIPMLLPNLPQMAWYWCILIAVVFFARPVRKIWFKGEGVK